MTAASHWENIYVTKDVSKVGWYQEIPSMTLALLEKIGSTSQDSIIDAGCGASVLADALIDSGYKDITLLDISPSALEIIKKRLGVIADLPVYCIGDVCTFSSEKLFDVWHDRAVFHFLQKEEDQQAYFDTLHKSLSPEGHAIIGTFGVNGPDSCSALPVCQYNEKHMRNLVQDRFDIVEVMDETHITPGGSEQHYCFFILKPIY